ncbi:mechanosensitive ion channel protein MscS [Halobacteriales archaeon QS_5_70_17]|jgi:small-conductance mechanosensitive channel|nr:MAG: mechanosensitive ion channel protein MscS [Halobacteriales archaeon QS_5_70_17]
MQVGEFSREVLQFLAESLVPLAVLVFGLIVGFLVGRFARRLMVAIGLRRAVEGTTFERSAQRLGTSTVGLIATLVTLFIYLAAIAGALELAGVFETRLSLVGFTDFLPQVFVAVFVVIVGLVVGDKAEVATRERLRSVRLTDVNLLPLLVKYSVYYVAALIALAELGLSIGALLVLLGGYLFAVVVLGGLALRDVLAAVSAGIYLLLTQPYGIGDEIEIDGKRGIVQEVDVFVTRFESDDEEFIVPNHLVFRGGVVRYR